MEDVGFVRFKLCGRWEVAQQQDQRGGFLVRFPLNGEPPR